MFQDRTILISLDIYDTTIVSVIAKQYDVNSRFIEAICTENGVKMNLDTETYKAIIVCNKPDDTVVVNNATILSNGNVLIELTQQMLAAEGRCKCDVMLLSADGNVDIKNLDINLLSTYALSTMPFYLDVKAFATSNEVITSANEYKTFVDYIAKSMVAEEEIEKNENIRKANEEERQSNEAKRQTNTQNAINACNTAKTNANNAASACKTQTDLCEIATNNVNEAIEGANNATNTCIEKTALCEEATTKANTATDLCNAVVKTCEEKTVLCEEATGLCNEATDKANIATNLCTTATQACEEKTVLCEEATTKANIATDLCTTTISSANTAISTCNTAITNANTAADRANLAAENCEGISDLTSVVLKSDLYDNNSLVKSSKLNTSFSSQSKNVIVSGEELGIILGKIAAYMNAFDNRQKILYNASNPSADPDNSIGNNGDIYVKVIQE